MGAFDDLIPQAPASSGAFGDLVPAERPESISRIATAVPQGATSGLYNAAMFLPDMSAWVSRKLGLVSPNTPAPSEMIQEAGRNARDQLGVAYNPNIVPETKAERIGFDVGNAAGQVAATAIPGGIVANAIKAPVAGMRVAAPTFGQTVGQTLAAQPGMQLAGTATGNITSDLTGNPYLGLGASLALPTAANTLMRIPFSAPARTGAEAERRGLLATGKEAGVLPSAATIMDSNFGRMVESVLTRLPFMGNVMERINEGNKTALNKAMVNKIPEVSGEGIDAFTPGTRDMISGRIGNKFDALESSTTVNIDPQVGADIAKAKADFSKQLVDQMPPPITRKLDELAAASATPGNPQIDGETYKNIRSKLSKSLTTASGTDRDAIGAMINALDGAVERSLPADMVKDWQDARTSWRRFMMLKEATDARHNAQTDKGHIPPGAVAARAGNDREMERLASVGTSFVGDKMPDSGTGSRLLIQNLMGLGAGAGGGAVFPWTTAALAGGGYLTNAAMNNPYMRRALINRLQRSKDSVLTKGLVATLAAQQAENEMGGP